LLGNRAGLLVEAQPATGPRSNGGMEQYGNTTTYNLENVLYQNIKTSLYWNRRAKDIADYDELVDEIYEQ
jgi:hypothetical protein